MSLTPEQETLSAALTNLQRLTVLGVVEGKSQRQAYRDAGGRAKTDEAADASASEILSHPQVRAFYESLTSQAAKSAGITLETLLGELEEARQAAYGGEKPQAAAMVAATMGKAKLLGLEAPGKLELTGANGGPMQMATLADFYTQDEAKP